MELWDAYDSAFRKESVMREIKIYPNQIDEAISVI